MILIGLGANLSSFRFGTPKMTLEASLEELESRGVHVVERSRWYSSAAVPPSDQPRYVNAVAAVATDLPPQALLELLHAIERDFGRRRAQKNAAREIDLDLLAYGDLVRVQSPPLLPHTCGRRLPSLLLNHKAARIYSSASLRWPLNLVTLMRPPICSKPY